MDGKYKTKMIPFSIEYEQSIKGTVNSKSQIQAIIKAGYEELEIIHFYTVGKD